MEWNINVVYRWHIHDVWWNMFCAFDSSSSEDQWTAAVQHKGTRSRFPSVHLIKGTKIKIINDKPRHVFDHFGENRDRKSTQIKCTRIFSWAFLHFLGLSLPLLGSNLLLLIQKCILNVLLSFQTMWNWKIYLLTDTFGEWGIVKRVVFLVFYPVLCKTFCTTKREYYRKLLQMWNTPNLLHLLQRFILLQQLTLRTEIKCTSHNVNSRLSLPCVLPYSSWNLDPTFKSLCIFLSCCFLFYSSFTLTLYKQNILIQLTFIKYFKLLNLGKPSPTSVSCL